MSGFITYSFNLCLFPLWKETVPVTLDHRYSIQTIKHDDHCHDQAFKTKCSVLWMMKSPQNWATNRKKLCDLNLYVVLMQKYKEITDLHQGHKLCLYYRVWYKK